MSSYFRNYGPKNEEGEYKIRPYSPEKNPDMFEPFIAFRILKTKKEHLFLSALSLICMVAVGLSVAAFLIIHAIMNGFSTHLKKSIIGFNSHVVVSRTVSTTEKPLFIDWLKTQPHVARSYPVVETDGIAQTDADVTVGLKIRGIDLAVLKDQPDIQFFNFQENADDSKKTVEVFVGEDLFDRLKLLPEGNQFITLINPLGDVGPTGDLEPRTLRIKVAGIFSTHFYDFDSRYALVTAPQAVKNLLGPPHESWTHWLIQLKNEREAPAFKAALESLDPTIVVTTWMEKNKRLVGALNLERRGMFLLLSLVTLIATFNILSLMALLAMGKTSEMALLEALGATPQTIRRIYLAVGAFLGIFGTIMGAVVGFGVLAFLKVYPLVLPQAYYLDHLPVLIDPATAAILLLMAPVFSVIASVWPAKVGSQLNLASKGLAQNLRNG